MKFSNFHAKNIIWLKFTINYSLLKLNYLWRHCSAPSLTVGLNIRVVPAHALKIRNPSSKQCDWLSLPDQCQFHSLYSCSLACLLGTIAVSHEGRKASHYNFLSEPHAPLFLVRATSESSSFEYYAHSKSRVPISEFSG